MARTKEEYANEKKGKISENRTVYPMSSSTWTVTGTVTSSGGSSGGTVTALQGTSPWVVSGTVDASVSLGGTMDVMVVNPYGVLTTDDYHFNDEDSTSSGTFEYYGFTNNSSSWSIRRLTISDNSMRYWSGTADYTSGWAARASGSYIY